jgi:hypothetical protein
MNTLTQDNNHEGVRGILTYINLNFRAGALWADESLRYLEKKVPNPL